MSSLIGPIGVIGTIRVIGPIGVLRAVRVVILSMLGVRVLMETIAAKSLMRMAPLTPYTLAPLSLRGALISFRIGTTAVRVLRRAWISIRVEAMARILALLISLGLIC
jgi:hypothetical protein